VVGNPNALPRSSWNKKSSSDLVLPVDPRTGAAMWTGRLIVKFKDELKVRADRGPTQFAAQADGRALPEIAAQLQSAGGTIQQAINRPVADLERLELKARTMSGKAQPDLASMMYVNVAPGRLLDAARAFNDMSIVEWVEFDRVIIPDGGGTNMSPQYGCGQNGAGDDAGANNCYTTAMAGRCSAIAGGNGCNNVGACNQDPIPIPCQFGCNNTACCDLVADILPGCNDAADPRGWDALCATYANIYCNGNIYSGSPPIAGGMTAPLAFYRYDPCFALRGPVDISATVVAIQGTAVDLTTAGPGGAGIVPTVTTQLMTYTLAPDGTVDPTTLGFVIYGVSSDEAAPDVAAQALPDPSLEGAQVSLSAGCFVEHPFVGCSQSSCCVYVCRNDPSCCTVEWDSGCATAALAATALAAAPCTAPALPPGVFAPGVLPSPWVTGGQASNGRARGYQVYTFVQPVLGPADVLPAGVGPNAGAVFPPTVRVNADSATARDDTTTQLGTLQFLTGGYRGGGYDLEGFELLASQLGIPSSGTRGKGIAAAVIEHAAYVNHEDLINRTTPEANQTQVLIVEDPINPNHGTAVLGIIGAEANNFGVTGIAPQCDLRFYPIVSREEGSRVLNAIANAIIDMEEGDLMNMSIGMGGGLTMAGFLPTFTLISVGTSVGITSIISAGNDASPVITVPEGAADDNADSGAVVVGACWPGFQNGLLTPTATAPGPFPGNNYCRLNFSNFTDQEADRGGQVHVCAWGTAMTTCGYGDLFRGLNDSADALQVNNLRTYTTQFNGTSSAAPMICGLAARAQCFAEAYFGAVLPPSSLRAALTTPVYLQCGMDYANPNFPGYPEDGSPFAGDLVPISAGGQLAAIGGFPNARGVLAYIVANTFGGSPVNVDVITGTLVGGNQFSLRQLDGISLKVSGVRKTAGSGGQGYGPILLYPFSGNTTDVQVNLVSVQNVDQINTLQMGAVSAVSSAVPVAEIAYFYNRVQNRWKSSGWANLSTAFPVGPQIYTPFGDPREYAIQNPTGTGSTIYARVYTCALAPGGYTVHHDLLTLVVNIDLQDAGGGGGGGGNP
jgi:hypothetical protein